MLRSPARALPSSGLAAESLWDILVCKCFPFSFLLAVGWEDDEGSWGQQVRRWQQTQGEKDALGAGEGASTWMQRRGKPTDTTLAVLLRMGTCIHPGGNVWAGLGDPQVGDGEVVCFLENLVLWWGLAWEGEVSAASPARLAPWHRWEADRGSSRGGSLEEQGSG